MHTGSCLCRAVRFEVSGELQPIEICYCKQCRKAQGGAMATNIPVRREQFRVTQGLSRLQEFESTSGKFRAFCSRCGSPLYSRLAANPRVMRLRAGALDGELPVRPALHAFVGSKADWWSINDELPQFDGFAPLT